jgi:predicted transposase/invertase (TIGR01784 family)
MVFADRRNADILRCFLAAALDIPEEQFEEAAVINSQPEQEYPEDKLGILDVRVITEGGKRIDIEIQLYEYPFLPERITYYACKNLTSRTASAEGYEAIRKIITIAIFDFPMLESPAYRHQFKLYDERGEALFTDVMEIHTLELSKLPKAGSGENLLLHWLRLLKARRLEEYEMLAEKNPTIQRTVDILKKLSSDNKARLAYEAREKAIRDELAKVRGAYSKGKIEGEEIGFTQGQRETRLDVAKNLLARGFEPEVIAECSGLTAEEVMSLINSGSREV